ncbi:MAG: hypothetical protein LBB43_04000 [Spirochaetaceae bacterium]|jgi:hypothetical protein|nr:hypothetical protein [Spirochaetaceae bacterium]
MNTQTSLRLPDEQPLYGEEISQAQQVSRLRAQEQAVSAQAIEDLQEVVDPNLGFLLDLSA